MRNILPVMGAASLLVSGCSSLQTPKVPGLERDNFKADQLVPVSAVLGALKVQLAEGFGEIARWKQEAAAANPPMAATHLSLFAFKKGSGTLSGTTQTVATDNGKIAAVIPFTGYSGSTLAPNIGATGGSTSLQTVALAFSIDPSLDPNSLMSATNLSSNVHVGTFVKDALVSTYFEVAKMPRKQDGSALTPTFQATEVSFTISFVVVRKVEGGITSTFLLPASGINSLAPSLGTSSERTGTYKLELKLPFGVDQPADPRVLIYSVHTNHPNAVYISEPYSERRYIELGGAKLPPPTANTNQQPFSVIDENAKTKVPRPAPEPPKF